jgi:hypothetical protein
MKLISTLLISLFAFSSQANEQVLTCDLAMLEPKGKESGIKVDGTLTIAKESDTRYVLNANAKFTKKGKSQQVKVQDVAPYMHFTETTTPSAEEVVQDDDNLGDIRDAFHIGQMVAELEVYPGEGFQQKGNGLNVAKYRTVHGNELTVVNVGWSFLRCK